MKINALKLFAFGPFTDKLIDFSGNGYGLHIVYGANEAGKSTALRALIGLLYGFAHRVEDAWLHENKELSVGGTLLLSNGNLLNLMRYKRRKNDLIIEDTGQPFNQADLDKYLGRMGREAFEHAFGICHNSLRLGVESVLSAGGDLGQALFAATSGLNTLKRVMTKLDVQQGQLFAPRAQKARINAGISQINALRKEQREASASHLHWKKMKKRLDELHQTGIDFEKQMEDLSAKTSLLSRHRDALKHVAIYEQLEKDLHEIGSVPDLQSDFSHDRVETQMAIKQAKKAEENLKKDLAEIDKKLDALFYDEKIINNEKLIENLSGNANIHTKAMRDSKSLKAQIYQYKEIAQTALSSLRPGLALESIASLRLSKPENAKLQRLSAKGAKLEESVNSTNRALCVAKKNLEKFQLQLDQLEDPENTEELKSSLSRATEYGKIEERLSDVKSEITLLQEQADTELAALSLWDGDLSGLARLAITTEETMRRFETDLTDLDRKLEDTERNNIEASNSMKEKEKKLIELTRIRELPSEDDLKEHRNLRNRGWKSVRAVWLEGGDVDQDFLSAFPEDLELADAYEKSVYKADDTADALREDAEAVAKAEALKKDIQELKSGLLAITKRVVGLTEQRTALWNQWKKLWEPLDIIPLTPREMIAWSSRVDGLRRKVGELRKCEIAADQLRQDFDQIRSEVASSLIRINVDIPDKKSFSGLIDLAKRTIQKADKLNEKRQEIEVRIYTLREEIDTLQERKNENEQSLHVWADNWALTIAKLGFDESARPEDVHDFILALDDIFNQLEKIKDFQARIVAIENDYRAYTKEVANTVENLAPELKDLAPEAAALELNARLKRDKDQRKEFQLLESEKRKKSSSLSETRENIAALDEKMRLLCSEAQAESPDDLPEIEKRAAKRIKLLDDFAKVNERLAELSSAQDLKSFIEQVKAHNLDELNAHLDRLTSDKQRHQDEQKKLLADIALAKNELETIAGESRATEIAEEAEGLAGEIQSEVEHYIKLRLSSAILSKAIERYRQSNQSPVLEASSKYFKAITRESFLGLRADYDYKGDPVIKAIRPNGSLLTVQELSDGSRDQLFLALRLGGLDKYTKNNEPVPFIVDDVLVHFDDDRSSAALYTMSRLANSTQIIFFTHHQHLVDLAKNTLPNEILRVQAI